MKIQIKEKKVITCFHAGLIGRRILFRGYFLGKERSGVILGGDEKKRNGADYKRNGADPHRQPGVMRKNYAAGADGERIQRRRIAACQVDTAEPRRRFIQRVDVFAVPALPR